MVRPKVKLLLPMGYCKQTVLLDTKVGNDNLLDICTVSILLSMTVMLSKIRVRSVQYIYSYDILHVYEKGRWKCYPISKQPKLIWHYCNSQNVQCKLLVKYPFHCYGITRSRCRNNISKTSLVKCLSMSSTFHSVINVIWFLWHHIEVSLFLDIR